MVGELAGGGGAVCVTAVEDAEFFLIGFEVGGVAVGEGACAGGVGDGFYASEAVVGVVERGGAVGVGGGEEEGGFGVVGVGGGGAARPDFQ